MGARALVVVALAALAVGRSAGQVCEWCDDVDEFDCGEHRSLIQVLSSGTDNYEIRELELTPGGGGGGDWDPVAVLQGTASSKVNAAAMFHDAPTGRACAVRTWSHGQAVDRRDDPPTPKTPSQRRGALNPAAVVRPLHYQKP